MIESVRQAYDPKDLWSEVAKRLCRRSLFGRPRLEWHAAIYDFLQEFARIEDQKGCILSATFEEVRDFLARLACHLSMKGDLAQGERRSVLAALHDDAAMPELRSERSKALLLKACFEAGRLRPLRQGFSGDLRTGMLTVAELLEHPLHAPLPKNSQIETATACAVPEYHLALALRYGGLNGYYQAVKEVSLKYENLDRAFEEIDLHGPSSDMERQFHSEYKNMAKRIHH